MTYYFVGTCVNSFDDDGSSLISCFNNVSDFAQQEESALKITKSEFESLVSNSSMLPKRHRYQYLITEDEEVLMAYDETKDVHYFFAL